MAARREGGWAEAARTGGAGPGSEHRGPVGKMGAYGKVLAGSAPYPACREGASLRLVLGLVVLSSGPSSGIIRQRWGSEV